MEFSPLQYFMRDKVKSEYEYIEDTLFLVAVVTGMERWKRTSEGVWRYKIGRRGCVPSVN